jgi:hypothetical protein
VTDLAADDIILCLFGMCDDPSRRMNVSGRRRIGTVIGTGSKKEGYRYQHQT